MRKINKKNRAILGFSTNSLFKLCFFEIKNISELRAREDL